MLEYFTYKKVKKHKAEKAAREAADPVIAPDDESFLENLIANDDAPAPPLPPRQYSREMDWHSDWESDGDEGTNKPVKAPTDPAPAKKQNRISALFTKHKEPEAKEKQPEAELKPEAGETSVKEEEKEKTDLSRVLDRLNLAVKNNKIIAATDSSAVLSRFTLVFKDLVNGVPTAYDDLAKIVEDKDGMLSRGFDKLPSSMKKLVMQLPDKITKSLGPELLAAAAASQGMKTDGSAGVKGAAKKALLPHNLYQLATKPGAVVGMLRAIVEVLKTRWPAFIGMNVIWGVALSCK